jgi:hypothetical protein
MLESLAALLSGLDGPLNPIRETAEKLLASEPEPQEEHGAILISRRPKIAPQAFACVLFPGLSDTMIDRYVQLWNAHRSLQPFRLPDAYRQVLRSLNGAWVFDLSLFGIPPSMCADPPLLNRGARQPLDISSAESWSRSYKPGPAQFHFGGSPYTWDENLGYFLNEDGSVEARRKGGAVFGCWKGMREFLEQEISRNEAAFPEHEERSAAFRAELERAEAEKRAQRRSRRAHRV